ncbi:MAG: hypothetical protein QHG98_07495 [Methanothrix sp.]|jgi:hypothetical protein|nr:hypothetical protein [Methanothrix sp.]
MVGLEMAHVHTGNMFIDRSRTPSVQDAGWMDVETYAKMRDPAALREYLKRKRAEQKDMIESIEAGLKMLMEDEEDILA